MDICSYLEDNNIVVGENDFPRATGNKNNWVISQQVDLIVFVQGILMGKKNTIIPRVNSTIGKDYEGLKVQVRKTQKSLDLLKNKNNKSELDYYVIDVAEKVINRSNKALIAINKNDYLDLIKRSMSNYEICLGRVDEGNLKVTGEGIVKIRTLKYLSYNLIEHDILNYIKKIKKRGYCGNINEIIDEFVNKSNLTIKSVDYLNALSSYPIESMRVLNNYKLDDISIGSNDFIKEINLAIKNDGKQLI